MMENGASGGHPLTGQRVLLMISAFFAAILVANGVMLSAAISTNSGVVANEPYRKGLKYNERIAADELQAQLGWTAAIALQPGAQRLAVVITDKAGHEVTGLAGKVIIGRPATDHDDHTVSLSETAPGHYEAKFDALDRGTYVAAVEIINPASSESDVIYRARRRLWAGQ